MRVVEVMTGTPYHCQPDSNLGTATELMWIGNCGFLPVVEEQGKVVGVITDRDICMALGTRGLPAGQVTAGQAMSKNVYFCEPDDDVHVALQAMRDAHVRRLPVISKKGELVGVVAMDDLLLRAEPIRVGHTPELSSDEVIRAFQAINAQQLPQTVATKAMAA
jgi:CBS domain-containing protein